MSGFWEGARDKRTRQLWSVGAAPGSFKSTMPSEELLRASLERVVAVTGAAAGAIYVEESSATWTLASSSGSPDLLLPRYGGLAADSSLARLVLESGNPVRLSSLADASSSSDGEGGLQPWAAVTLFALDVPQGIVVLFNRGRGMLIEPDLEVLGLVGHLVGLSLANTLAHEVALAHIDHQLEQRLAEIEAVISSMSDGLLICDEEGTIVRANSAAAQALGSPASELLGQSMLTPEWNHLAGGPAQEAGETQGPLSGVILSGEECKDCFLEFSGMGGTRVVRVSASPIRNADGTRGGVVAMVRDVTEERLARNVEEFLSLLSHELRAPLTIVSGYAQMLSRKLTRKGLTEEATSADLIKAQVIRMSGMVADLVESGRLEEGIGEVTRESTNLGDLVQSTVARIIREQRHSSEKHPITVEIEPDLPPVEVDPRRLDQVLTNLLSNSIRYSPDGGRIGVAVGREPSGGLTCQDEQEAREPGTGMQKLRVTVTDEGIGVPPEEREHIFERAYRGKLGQSISAQGLGLGLYICKLIVNRQGGEIGVTDGPGGKGSTFWFTLPSAASRDIV